MAIIPLNIKLELRAKSLKKNLYRDYPIAEIKKAGLKKGSPEWVSWHYGYYNALNDVLNLMGEEIIKPLNADNP